jgi:tetratricopeptide (TPR) repeat protein
VSTVLNLELYFEHRNYLAAAFLALPLVALGQRQLSARQFVVVCTLVCALLAGFTRYSATVWQSYPSIVAASAQKAPGSARAQSQHALNLYNAGRHDDAIVVIEAALKRMPQDTAVDVTRTTLLCNMGILTPEQFAEFSERMAARTFDPRAVNMLTTMLEGILAQRCPAVTIDDAANMFLAMSRSPDNSGPGSLRYSQLQYFIGLSVLSGGDLQQAIEHFDRSLMSRPGASHAMLMAAHLATQEHYDEALHFSDIALRQFDEAPDNLLAAERVRREDILTFQEQVRAERDAASADGGDTPWSIVVDFELTGQPAPDVRPAQADRKHDGEDDQGYPGELGHRVDTQNAEVDHQPDEPAKQQRFENQPEGAHGALRGRKQDNPSDQDDDADNEVLRTEPAIRETVLYPVCKRPAARVVRCKNQHESGNKANKKPRPVELGRCSAACRCSIFILVIHASLFPGWIDCSAEDERS